MSTEGLKRVIVYEFYYRDGIKGYQPFAVLTERRKDPARISEESIMNWGRSILGDKTDVEDLFYIKKTLNFVEKPNPFSNRGPQRGEEE